MKYLSYAFLALLTAFPFVSRASIASKLNDLEDCRVAITNAIVAKGGTASGALANAAAEIAALPSGGGGRNWRGYNPPVDWPDIPQIMDDNKEDGYAYAMAFLMHPSQEMVQLFSYDSMKFKCSDGFVSTTNAIHYWTDTGYHWCVVLGNNKLFRLSYEVYENPNVLIGTGERAKTLLVYGDGESQIILKSWISFVSGGGVGCNVNALLCNFYLPNRDSGGFRSCRCLEFVKGKVFTESANSSYNFEGFIGGCSSLRVIDLDFQGATVQCTYGTKESLSGASCLYSVDFLRSIKGIQNAYGTFLNCVNIVDLSNLEIDLSACTQAHFLFRGCTNLRRVFDDIDLKICTALIDPFEGCISLEALPTNVTVNISMSFSQCTGVKYKQSVATFDAGGNVVGGFVGNLRSWDGTQYVDACPNSGQTITLNSAIKALFTSTEQAAIVAALTAKNWTLAW